MRQIVIRCVDCDSEISKSVSYKTINKGLIIRPSDVNAITVQDIENTDRKKVVCSCGQTLGEAACVKENWRYLLHYKKITRSVITNSPCQLQLPCSSKEESSTENSNEPSCSCEKSADFFEMKKKIEKLELEMNSMKKENVSKFKDMSKMLLMHKLEILRLQEIIWSLHPNVDLSSAFMVNNNDISEALNGIVETYEEDSGFGTATSGC